MAIDPTNLAGTAKLAFGDEFNNLSLWNGSSGSWATQYWYDDGWGGVTTSNGGNLAGSVGSQEWYINANYAPTASVKPWTVANGMLTITAAPASAAIQKLIDGFKYTSGEINSYNSFSQEYGYFEMRAQLPHGQGLWPAFWLLPEDHSWPPEIDIFEVLGNNTTQVMVTAHSQATGVHTQVGTAVTVPDVSQGFHTYGMDWEKDYITWYFDGKKIFQAPTPADMHKPMYIQANLGVGGYWPGNADATTPFPAKMIIDYIHVYKDAGAAVSPPPPAQLFALPNSAAWTHSFTGTSAADTLVGTSGPDYVWGAAGADRMIGGKGDDTYVVGVTGDVVVEKAGEGTDTILSWPTTYTLPANVENMKLVAGFAQTGIGNDLANKLVSNDYASTLNGMGGNDILYAGKGGGVLTGGAGSDIFVLKAGAAKSVTVTDFDPNSGDVVDLRPLFAAAGYHGANPVADHYLGLASSGGGTAVWFDKDGAGPAAAVQVAFLDHVAPTALQAQNDWVFV
jgi:beta-glucanase (GH16 family)